MAFCIPDALYQWTVMSFGLKVAPSLFQKAMTKIYKSIMHHSLIYIDDILLFYETIEEHTKLLHQFAQITKKYGIMLSGSKSIIGHAQIDFLGMRLNNGKYEPDPHLAEELLKFPDENLTQKQIQMFLEIITSKLLFHM